MPEPYKGQFENIKFPPYKFREYPKWLYPKDKEPVLVESQKDEIEYLATDPSAATSVNSPSSSDSSKAAMELNALRDQNLKMAEELEKLKAELMKKDEKPPDLRALMQETIPVSKLVSEKK